MNWTQVGSKYWVSPQISIDQISQAKGFDINVIVCNRPDGETPDQIPHTAIQDACAENDIEFVFLPMQGPNFTDDYVAKVKQLVADDKKVLAYCRTGNRSSVLYNAAIS